MPEARASNRRDVIAGLLASITGVIDEPIAEQTAVRGITATDREFAGELLAVIEGRDG